MRVAKERVCGEVELLRLLSNPPPVPGREPHNFFVTMAFVPDDNY